MIYDDYMRRDQETILELLSKLYHLERTVDSLNHMVADLKSQIRIMEQTTARECLGGDISMGMDSSVPPEKRPEIKSAKKRIKAAKDLFEKNFDPMGNPTTELGNKLSNRYRY